MDIRFLSTFLEVCKTRHFGKAAENLFLTQAAVSARIKLLEEFFNVKLFVRHRNSIQLTAAGEQLLPYAHDLTDTMKKAQLSLSEEGADFISLAATHCAYDIFLESALVALLPTFANLHIKAEILSAEVLLRQLLEHTVDIGFTTEPLKSDDIEKTALWHSELMLYANQPHDGLGELAKGSAVYVDYGNKTNERLNKALEALKGPRLRTSSPRLAFQEITQRAELSSICVLPQRWLEMQAGQQALSTIATANLSGLTVYACFRKDNQLNELRTIVESLTD